jgi:hypothetical protein
MDVSKASESRNLLEIRIQGNKLLLRTKHRDIHRHIRFGK